MVSHDDESVSAESGYLRETGNLVFHTGALRRHRRRRGRAPARVAGRRHRHRGRDVLVDAVVLRLVPAGTDDRPREAPAVHDRPRLDERHLRGPGGRGPVRRAPRASRPTSRTTERPGGPSAQAADQPEPPGHPRRRRRLPARQRVCAGRDGPRRDRRGALPAGDAVPRPGQPLHVRGGDQGRGGAADGAGVQRVLPADRRADVRERARLDLPGRPQPRAGAVGVGGRPLPARPAAVGLHPRHRPTSPS